MITVIATIELADGTRDSFLEEFHKIVPAVRAEDGCILYGPTIDAETDLEKQSRNPNRVTIVEQWESLDKLKAHLVADHMVEYRPKVADFVKSSELRVLENA